MKPSSGGRSRRPRIPLSGARLYELAYYQGLPEDGRFVDFLGRLLRRHAPGRKVLDCACGTGEPGLSLARHFSLTLSDASDDMLALARRKASRRDLGDLPILRAEWAELPQVLPARFDAVICCGNSLAQACTASELRSALAGMAAMVEQRGVLYLDFREDYTSVSREFKLTEVLGPVHWRAKDYLVAICERQEAELMERLKLCYQALGARIHLVGRHATKYLPIARQDLRRQLRQLGFSSIRLYRRPGRWRLTSLLACRAER